MQDTDIKNVKLVINSQDAERKLRNISTKIEEIKKKKIEALEKGDNEGLKQYTRELINLQKEQAKIETRAHGIEQVLKNLDKATPNQLKSTLREINKELNNGSVERGSKEWNSLTDSIHQCNEQLSKIKSETNAVHQSFTDKITSWGNKWMGLTMNIQAALMALSGVKTTLQQSVQAFADMEEAEAQVMKYTGLSKAGVDDMNKSLQQMDTRTSREKLNELAGDAGKLGITSKAAMLEFVDAADKINVALGDDLGDDAVKNVGKLAMMFGEDKKMGLRAAMLATGSVINELSQNSSAGAGYLEEFTARVAGVGKVANMTQQQIMGFASVLDANMQQDETAATAFSQLITKMAQDPAKFAQLAGKSVKDFSYLIKTDMNEAIKQFLMAMHAKGGFSELAPMFESMNLNGSRATGVLSTLADKMSDVNKMQSLANQSYEQGISITNEFNVQNNTVQAGLDKAKKHFNEVRIQLGQQLIPIVRNGLHFTSMWISLLSKLITFTAAHIKTIVSLIAALATYISIVKILQVLEAIETTWIWKKITAMRSLLTVTKLQTLAINLYRTAVGLANVVMILFTKGIKAAVIEFEILKVTMAQNPIGLVAILLATLVGTLLQFTNILGGSASETERLNAAQKKQSKLITDINDAQTEANKSTSETKNRINTLTKIINDHNRSLKDRQDALHALKKIVPDYHANLTKEGKLINNNTEAIQNHIKELDKMALAEAIYGKLKDALSKQVDIDMTIDKWKRMIADRNSKLKTESFSLTGGELQRFKAQNHIVDTEIAVFNTSLTKAINQDKANKDYIKGLHKYAQKTGASKGLEKLEASGGESTESASGNTTSFLTEKQKKQLAKEQKAKAAAERKKEAEERKKIAAEKKDTKEHQEKIATEAEAEKVQRQLEYQSGIIDKREYEDNLVAIEDESLKKQQSLYKKGSEEWNKLEIKRQENEVKTIQQFNDWSIQDIDRQEQEELARKKGYFADGIIDEKQYQQATLDVKRDFLKRRAAYLHSVGSEEEAIKYDKQVRDIDQEDQINKRKEFLTKWNDLQKQIAPEMTDAKKLQKQYEKDQQFLKESLDKKLITQEQYNTSSKQLQDKYNKDLKDITDKIAEKLGMPTDQLSSSFITLINQIQTMNAALKNGETGWQTYAGTAIAALGMISSIASSASQLFTAEQSSEEAAVNEKYDKEIQAAGTSTARGKELENKKQKELTEIKNKYSKKAAAMQIAQAISDTAANAIKAYGAMAEIPIVGPALGIAAAAMATASGMIQIAIIKKQQQAQSSGYYSGGYTGGSNYHQEAGVVHEGEFVANHQALQNPTLTPMFQMLDYAQRNNTVGSLSTADVSRAILAPQTTAVSTIQMASNTKQVSKNEEGTAAIERLNENIEKGINAVVVIDGPDGFDRQYSKYKKLKSRI